MGQRLQRAGRVLVWVLVGFEAVGFGAAGLGKFLGNHWQELFAGWGYASWFCYLIGAIEITGAVGLLVPRLTSYAALLLILVMMGAEYTLLTHPGPAGFVAPLGHIATFMILAAARWNRRARSAPSPSAARA